MIIISHRGNLRGPDASNENRPSIIERVLSETKFHVEIDVWYTENKELFLGHDEPKYRVEASFLDNERLWCHAKNLNALEFLIINKNNKKYFWHENDKYTLTSNKIIWTFPLEKTTKNSIIVCNTLKETQKYFKENVFGLCSDYVGLIK